MDPWWRALLLMGGATPQNSYVELDNGQITLSFGFFFRRTLARSDVERAEEAKWPVWMGVGWRTNFGDRLGLIGSYEGVVELHLRTPIRVWGLLNCKRVAVSVEEPAALVAALS
jgi:hypothetical protein